jgi:hypothetical protein
MDPIRFEARLRTEGFPEIRTNQMSCRHVEDAGPLGVKDLVGRRPVS